MEAVVESRPTGWHRQDRLVVDLSVWLDEEKPRFVEERRFVVAPSPRDEQPPLSHRWFRGTVRDGQSFELPVSLELFRALARLSADPDDVDASHGELVEAPVELSHWAPKRDSAVHGRTRPS